MIKTQADFLGIKIIVGDLDKYDLNSIKDDLCGVLAQCPDRNGQLRDFTEIFAKLKGNSLRCLATDLLALTIVKSPKE